MVQFIAYFILFSEEPFIYGVSGILGEEPFEYAEFSIPAVSVEDAVTCLGGIERFRCRRCICAGGEIFLKKG